MTLVRNDATGEEFEAPDDQVGTLATQGGFSFPAGTQVAIKHSDGAIESIPVEQFWAQPGVLKAATPEDLQARAAEQQRVAEEAQDAALQEQYGSGLLNMARASAEGGARGLSLGLSDALLAQMGADPTGLKERAERNPLASTAGEVAGAIAPLLISGGGSAGAQAGAKAATRAAAAATPTAIADAIGAKVGAKVAAELGEGFSARLASGAARAAAEGALAGVGGEISARSLDGQDLLDPGTMDEYLMAAGMGGLVGGALGGAGSLVGEGLGAAAHAGKRGLEKARGYAAETFGAHVREAEAGLAKALTEGDAGIAAARAADYDVDVRAAEQRLGSLEADTGEVAKLQGLRERAQAKLEASAPGQRVLTGAAGQRADASLEKALAAAKAEAKTLGVSDDVADSAMDRIRNGKREFDNLDATHDTTVRELAAKGDELEKLKADLEDTLEMSRRNDSMREAHAVDSTAPPPEQGVAALKSQHDKILAQISELAGDADPQVQSLAKNLQKRLRDQISDFDKLAGKRLTKAEAADAFELLDQTNRIVGRQAKKAGQRIQGHAPEALQNLYNETRDVLKNPAIVGESVAGISGRAKGRWTDKFDVNSGYDRALLRGDAGGARTLSGFDTVDRWDPKKLSGVLRGSEAAEGQLDLELVGRGLDTSVGLLEHFANDLKLGPGELAKINRARQLTREIADGVVAYRSRVALAKEFAAAAAPALRDVENLDAAILKARGAADEKLATARARAQEKLEAAMAKRDAARDAGIEKATAARDKAVEKARAALDAAGERGAESMAGLLVEGLGPTIGMAVGGPMGAAFGYTAGKVLSGMSTPVIRSVAKTVLSGMLKNQEKASQFAAVRKIGQRVARAGAAVVDRLHAAGPYRAASRVAAARAAKIESPRDTQEEYDRTLSWAREAAPYDARAAYLASIAPESSKPAQLRPDLDTTPTVHPLAQRKFLRAARAAMDPAGALESLARGTQSREGAEVLKTLYPRLRDQALTSILDGAAGMKRKPSMRGQQELSLFFGQPVHFTMEPRFVAFSQSVYQQAQANGTANQDMLQSSQPQDRARQINSKAAQLQATGMQRLETDIE